jgi:hypothetical protein
MGVGEWGLVAAFAAGAFGADLRIATFRADATPDPGEPLIWVTPAAKVEDPLWAKGVVIESGGARYVLCAVDWCGIGGRTHRMLREKIAGAAGTKAAHVALQTVHQHTAPYIDGDGYALAAGLPSPQLMMSEAYLARLGERLAAAAREAVRKLEPFDSIGTGEARVERVASARRVFKDGKLLVRYSTGGKDAAMAALPEGAIDPRVRTVTFAARGRPLARLHFYATHPQTWCCDGRVSADFAGVAREDVERREKIFQVYFTGCAGDVTVGKYNDASPEARERLRERLRSGMEAAIAATKFARAGALAWRMEPLRLPRKPAPEVRDYRSSIAAAFAAREAPLETFALAAGPARLLFLPGEPMLEFQEYARGLRPGQFVAVAGYGDISPGYLCTDRAFEEGGYEPSAANAGPGTEARVKEAIRRLLR